MKNENLKKLKKLLKNSEDSYIISTKRGVGIIGDGINVLTQFGMLTATLKNSFPENLLREIFELSFENKSKLSKRKKRYKRKLMNFLKNCWGICNE